jgi:hypothetical protein
MCIENFILGTLEKLLFFFSSSTTYQGRFRTGGADRKVLDRLKFSLFIDRYRIDMG